MIIQKRWPPTSFPLVNSVGMIGYFRYRYNGYFMYTECPDPRRFCQAGHPWSDTNLTMNNSSSGLKLKSTVDGDLGKDCVYGTTATTAIHGQLAIVHKGSSMVYRVKKDIKERSRSLRQKESSGHSFSNSRWWLFGKSYNIHIINQSRSLLAGS